MKQKAEMIQAMIKERKTNEAQSQYYRDLLKHPDRKVYKVGDLIWCIYIMVMVLNCMCQLRNSKRIR